VLLAVLLCLIQSTQACPPVLLHLQHLKCALTYVACFYEQLGFHAKPIGLLNTEGFYDPLLAFFKHCVDEVGDGGLLLTSVVKAVGCYTTVEFDNCSSAILIFRGCSAWELV
jgi:hypothetical protein